MMERCKEFDLAEWIGFQLGRASGVEASHCHFDYFLINKVGVNPP